MLARCAPADACSERTPCSVAGEAAARATWKGREIWGEEHAEGAPRGRTGVVGVQRAVALDCKAVYGLCKESMAVGE